MSAQYEWWYGSRAIPAEEQQRIEKRSGKAPDPIVRPLPVRLDPVGEIRTLYEEEEASRLDRCGMCGGSLDRAVVRRRGAREVYCSRRCHHAAELARRSEGEAV